MPELNTTPGDTTKKAWVITGPTSGIGYQTALHLAEHGIVILVGRDASKLAAVKAKIESKGGEAVTVLADLSDIVSARRAAGEISALGLPIGGVLNNAGIMPMKPFTTAQGWDGAFATNHLGPLAFTEALVPTLDANTNIVFICAAVEDPARKIATRAGFRGSRYISAEAAARGEYLPGGSSRVAFDAYATSKQGNLASVFSLAREHRNLRFRGVEPGVNPGSNLGREMGPVIGAMSKGLAPILSLMPYYSTPKKAARVITKIVTDPSEATGIYYNEKGEPMRASEQVSDPTFSDRYLAESRALIASAAATD